MNKIFKLILFVLIHATLCVAFVLAAGWLLMQIYLWPNKVNEFSSLFVIIAAYVSPFIWLVALPFHLFFYFKKPQAKNRLSVYVSFLLAALYFFGLLLIQKG